MTDSIYYVIDNLVEISKVEYDEAGKNAQQLLFIKPFGFMWSKGARKVAYITSAGKFYKSEIPVEQHMRSNLMDTFDFLYVDIRAPQAVFKRKPFPNEIAKQQQRKNKVDVMSPPRTKKAS